MSIMKSSVRGSAVSWILVACCGAAFLAPPARADEKTAPTGPATAAANKKESKMKTTPSGLQYEDTVEGTGASPKTGQTCVMHYTGWLWENSAKGKKFDSSLDRGRPFEFPLGQGRVIKGWDEGVATMKVGGKRTLLIPPSLGYGARGAGGAIPPNATLLFEVELLGVK
jgi:peptidylprolyl isomerase